MLAQHSRAELHVDPREPKLVEWPQAPRGACAFPVRLDVTELEMGASGRFPRWEAPADQILCAELDVVAELLTDLRFDGGSPAETAEE
jgi:hypothetical protein